jgi:hypothetical protein
MTRAALLAAVAALVLAPSAAAYERDAEYLWFETSQIAPLETDYGVRIYLRGGVPMVNYDYGAWEARNPTTIAQYGLAEHARYVTRGGPIRRRRALRAAGWLVRAQQDDGTWRYPFDYEVGTRHHLDAGWSSAIAQGQAISLLVRAYDLTGSRTYLRAARMAVLPLNLDVEDGGLRTRFDGGTWFEEYPTREPSYVLNGFMFAVLGLYDVAAYSPTARRLYAEGRATLRRALPTYDLGAGCSRYAHTADAEGRDPWRASHVYRPVHVGLLRGLDSIGRDGLLRYYAARWEPGC